MRKIETTASVKPGDFTGVTAEFGRCQDLQRVFSIRRGTAYNLLRDGKIKAVLLRIRGQKSGVRLFDMGSVRNFILSEMAAADPGEDAVQQVTAPRERDMSKQRARCQVDDREI